MTSTIYLADLQEEGCLASLVNESIFEHFRNDDKLVLLDTGIFSMNFCNFMVDCINAEGSRFRCSSPLLSSFQTVMGSNYFNLHIIWQKVVAWCILQYLWSASPAHFQNFWKTIFSPFGRHFVSFHANVFIFGMQPLDDNTFVVWKIHD